MFTETTVAILQIDKSEFNVSTAPPIFRCPCIRSHASTSFQFHHFQVSLLFFALVAVSPVLSIRVRRDGARIPSFTRLASVAGRSTGRFWSSCLRFGMGVEQQGEMPSVHDSTSSSQTLSEKPSSPAVARKLSPSGRDQRAFQEPFPLPLLRGSDKNRPS